MNNNNNNNNSHESRYDRQLRLWEARGQARIEEAHIHLLSVTAVITDVLKNLVLAGIRSYSIEPAAADRLITQADCDSNYFLSPESLGKPVSSVLPVQMTALNASVRCIEDASKIPPPSLVMVSGEEEAQGFMCMNIPVLEVLEGGPYAAIRLTKSEHFGKLIHAHACLWEFIR